MYKMLWLVIVVCLLIPGCNVNPNARLENLEKRVETVENRLDSCESNVYSISQRQDVIESSYNESISKQKSEMPAAASTSSLASQDIQTALKNAGFYSGSIDGKIGPNTEKAIRDFQQANGLTADGVVGAKTKSLLIKYLQQGQAVD